MKTAICQQPFPTLRKFGLMILYLMYGIALTLILLLSALFLFWPFDARDNEKFKKSVPRPIMKAVNFIAKLAFIAYLSGGAYYLFKLSR